MIYDTGKYIDILIKLDITPKQFLFAWLVYNKQWNDLKRYMEHLGGLIIDSEEMKDLIDKDIILTFGPKNREEITARDMHVTEKFAGEMAIEPSDAWYEFFAEYPGKVRVNGNVFAAKGLTISDEKACREKYEIVVGNNRLLHNKIVSLTKEYAKQNDGNAVMKIDKFVISEFWNEIEQGKGGAYVGTALF